MLSCLRGVYSAIAPGIFTLTPSPRRRTIYLQTAKICCSRVTMRCNEKGAGRRREVITTSQTLPGPMLNRVTTANISPTSRLRALQWLRGSQLTDEESILKLWSMSPSFGDEFEMAKWEMATLLTRTCPIDKLAHLTYRQRQERQKA